MNELRWILLGCGLALLLGIFLWGRRSRGQAANDDDSGTYGRLDPPPKQHAPVPVQFPGSEPTEQPVANRWQDDEWNSTVTDLPEMRFDALGAFDDPLEPTLDNDEAILPAEGDFAVSPVRSEEEVRAPLHRQSEVAAPSAAELPREPPPRSKSEKRKIVALRLSSPANERYSGDRLRAALEAAGLTHGKYGIFHRMHGNAGSIFSVAGMVEPGAFDLETMDQAKFAGVTVFALLPGPAKAAQTYDQLLECARYLEKTLGGGLHDERGLPLTVQRIASLREEVLDFEHLLGSTTAGSVA